MLNGKDGVRRTTITADVGGMLTAGGSVLLVDLDPRANLAEELGYAGTPVYDDILAFAQALAFGTPVTRQAGVRENLDVLVGGARLDMAAAGLTMRSYMDTRGAKTALADAVAEYAVKTTVCGARAATGRRGYDTPSVGVPKVTAET